MAAPARETDPHIIVMHYVPYTKPGATLPCVFVSPFAHYLNLSTAASVAVPVARAAVSSIDEWTIRRGDGGIRC